MIPFHLTSACTQDLYKDIYKVNLYNNDNDDDDRITKDSKYK